VLVVPVVVDGEVDPLYDAVCSWCGILATRRLAVAAEEDASWHILRALHTTDPGPTAMPASPLGQEEPARAVWPAPALARQLREHSRTTTRVLSAHLRIAADILEGVGARVDDVEELDAVVLSQEDPVEEVTVLDRFGEVHVIHPQRTGGGPLVVRHPSLREALTGPADWPVPLAHPTSELDQCRFPMFVIAAPAAFLPPDFA